MFKYATLQRTFANLHFSDPELLRTAGLSALGRVYSAYPTTCEGTRLCILLPHGLGPREASRMGELAAVSRRVMVFKQEPGKWTQIWPSGTPSNEPDLIEVEEE